CTRTRHSTVVVTPLWSATATTILNILVVDGTWKRHVFPRLTSCPFSFQVYVSRSSVSGSTASTAKNCSSPTANGIVVLARGDTLTMVGGRFTLRTRTFQ